MLKELIFESVAGVMILKETYPQRTPSRNDYFKLAFSGEFSC